MAEIWLNSIIKRLKRFSARQSAITAVVITVCLILAATFFTTTADEANWVLAGQDFHRAIVELNPANTYVTEVSHRLGVTVLWVSTLIYAFFGSQPFNNLLLIHRLVFLLINLGLFGWALITLKKYIDAKVLILAVIYLCLNRFFPLIGRSTWLDQLLTFFGLLTVIFWTKYLFERKRSQLITAAIFNGLLLLTKYAGWYFTPIIFALSLAYCYKLRIPIKELIKPLIFFVIASLFIFVLFYPAVWVEPFKALFLRLEDTSIVVKKPQDIWDYLSEIRLINPVLVVGSIICTLDWKRKTRDFLFFFSLAGLFYLGIYLVTFLGLILTGRLDYAFLEGIYRYTFPAIPIFTFYTFSRYKTYLKSRETQLALLLFLFICEIIFSPFLLFGKF